MQDPKTGQILNQLHNAPHRDELAFYFADNVMEQTRAKLCESDTSLCILSPHTREGKCSGVSRRSKKASEKSISVRPLQQHEIQWIYFGLKLSSRAREHNRLQSREKVVDGGG